MKIKLFLFAIVVFLDSNIQAQQIPNSGFENWSTQGPFETPNGWDARPSVSKSTDAHSGGYAIKLETAAFLNPQTSLTDTLVGELNTGSQGMGPNAPGIRGFATNLRPDSMVGWFKFAPTNLDTFIVRVEFTKWNASSNSHEVVCSNVFLDGSSNIYKRFSIPLNYISSSIPDSANITILNTVFNPPSTASFGNVLLIDDLGFILDETGIEESIIDNLNVYPNPAKDKIYINNIKDNRFEFYDMLGNLCFSFQTNGRKNLEVDVTSLPAGMYILMGTETLSKAIIIIK